MDNYKSKISTIFNRLYSKDTAFELEVSENPVKSNKNDDVYTVIMNLDRVLTDVKKRFNNFSREDIAIRINKAAEYVRKVHKPVDPNSIFFEFKDGKTLNRLNNAVTGAFYRTLSRLKVMEYELRTVLNKEAPSIVTMDKPLYEQDIDTMLGKPQNEASKVTYLIDKFTAQNNIGRYFTDEIKDLLNYGKIIKVDYDIEKYLYDTTENHDLNITIYGTNNSLHNKYGGNRYVSFKRLMPNLIMEEFPQFKELNINVTLW